MTTPQDAEAVRASHARGHGGDLPGAAWTRAPIRPPGPPYFTRREGSHPLDGGFLVPPELRSEILRTALESHLAGPFDPDAPKPPPPTWREKVRRKRQHLRTRAAGLAYRAISGEWPHREDDW